MGLSNSFIPTWEKRSIQKSRFLILIIQLFAILSFLFLIIIAYLALNPIEAQEPDICTLEVVDCPNEPQTPVIEAWQATESVKNPFRGESSHYDYMLPSGWSSLGHYVCATRVREWRYKMVRVTDLDTGKYVDCLQTDHGPSEEIFPERIVDLSSTSFSVLKDLKYGVIKNVSIELL